MAMPGEAPSRYFFAQLKAKQVRDTIVELVDPGQNPITSDPGLVHKVESTFKEVFTADPEVQANEVERQSVLSKMTAQISELENRALCAAPSAKEITSVVFNLKQEKASGVDGLTAEMLQVC
jgi:hypothetical protein